MRYHALALDYDGTLATHGQVGASTIDALKRLRSSGRKLILVTGRILEDLLKVFPSIELFDWLVVENGAVIYNPATREEKLLAQRPPHAFIDALEAQGVKPLSVGKIIVATWEPHDATVLRVIHDMALELQIIFNKGAVMVLPSAVNKAFGLSAALDEMGLSPHNVVAAGDAENDHAFLSLCECSVAVANALPMIKEYADVVTNGERGQGIEEVIAQLIESDLQEQAHRLTRHFLNIGHNDTSQAITIAPYGESILLAGSSGSGKSTFATSILEQLLEHQYQFCIIDPEGDYQVLPHTVVLGNTKQPPAIEEIIKLLEEPNQNAVANLLGVPLADRPAFFDRLLTALLAMRARTGRPHWLVIDEAHHLLPASWAAGTIKASGQFQNTIFITVHPAQVTILALDAIATLIVTGEEPEKTIKDYCQSLNESTPSVPYKKLLPGEAIGWRRNTNQAFWLHGIPPKTERRRHLRKYVQGELGPDKSFYFRGPQNKLNLRAQNLLLFIQCAEGVDDETWLYHLHSGDYSRWFKTDIKDEALAREAEHIANSKNLSAKESRAQIKAKIEELYTAPS